MNSEYIKISELENRPFMTVGFNVIFVLNCKVYIDKIECDLAVAAEEGVEEDAEQDLLTSNKIIFEKKAVYPFSKHFDVKGKVDKDRFTQFLNWEFLKNIDYILAL